LRRAYGGAIFARAVENIVALIDDLQSGPKKKRRPYRKRAG